MKKITSVENKYYKELKKINKLKDGTVLIEGLRFVEECIIENKEIKYLIVSETFYKKNINEIMDIENKFLGNFESICFSDSLFEKISNTENPQGIAVITKLDTQNIIVKKLKEECFFIILDGLSDPGNLGTIIRTADSCNVTGVILLNNCISPCNSKVLRSTMGSILRVPLYIYKDIKEYFNFIEENKIKTYLADLEGEKNYFDVKYTGRFAIIIGNEANGISDEVKNKSDEIIKIPILGRNESLNASIASGILMYEYVRQKLTC